MSIAWLVLGLAIAVIVAGVLIYVHLGARAVLARRQPDAECTPMVYGLPFEEVTFSSRDGVLLYGRFIPASEPAPLGTVVFCHGQAGSLSRDTSLVPPFHEAGFNVMMFDFRGHGRSEGEIVTLGYLERQDLLGALDCLGRRGIHRVGVIGFSMGGAVAISTARDTPAIGAVISDSGYASLRGVLAGAARERGIPESLARLTAILVLKCSGRRLGIDLSKYEPDRVVDENYRCPFLAIQGDADPYVPLHDMRAIVRCAGGPTELWAIAGVGHREARERLPEAYRQRVLAFFERWLAGGPG